MAVRVHLGGADLRRVTVARCAEPLCEIERSLRTLRSPAGDPATARWGRWAARRLPRAAHPLLALVPGGGPCPDFLTPLTTSPELGTALDAVTSTPRSRLSRELGPFAARRGTAAAWADDLRRGRTPALRRLEQAIRGYHGAVIEPLGQHLTAAFDSAAAGLVRTLARDGLDALLAELHPTIRWEPPVLHVAHEYMDGDVRLHGQGLHLVPSFFARSNAVMDEAGSPYVVVFPMRERAPWPGRDDPQDRALAALLGETRAGLLYAIGQAQGISTASLARRAGIADSTTSHHVTALRGARLVATRRSGAGVLHTLTPLGEDVLRSNPRRTR
ncbi:helix-turn-helix domain-containing protein [Streptomyces marincola]|uniref:helix-turn-helix domain-containing protein n=1 Tax=Streptomyces marincola TaxID=2878388 RepID=UPI001CF394A8|nr:helix-turn-helix domain-containing protein [Streptomyces marincola]UCM87897.1 helix-turn-helix domain-containing protein [Streptomyces marincola]